MKAYRKVVTGYVALVAMLSLGCLLFPDGAQAVPNFARKTGLPCSKCHASFPRLNAFGREFFRNGYVRTGEKEAQIELSETSFLEPNLLGLFLKMRPYDKKRSGDTQIRSIHEVELFLAGTSGGSLGKNLSFFTEIEAEDETDFEPEFAPVEIAYHFMPEFAVVLGNRSLADGDPFRTISNSGKTTRSERQILGQTFSSGDNLSKKQNVGVQGFLANSLFYGARLGADVGDPEGEGHEDLALRLAYIPPVLDNSFSIGTYWGKGKQGSVDEAGVDTGDLDASRLIFDAMYDQELFTLIFAYQLAKDDIAGGGDEQNGGFYGEASYYFRRDGNPFIVPTLRLDQYEEADGEEDFTDVTLNVAVYLRENLKAFVEYWQQLDIPTDGKKDNRLTFQIEVGL